VPTIFRIWSSWPLHRGPIPRKRSEHRLRVTTNFRNHNRSGTGRLKVTPMPRQFFRPVSGTQPKAKPESLPTSPPSQAPLRRNATETKTKGPCAQLARPGQELENVRARGSGDAWFPADQCFATVPLVIDLDGYKLLVISVRSYYTPCPHTPARKRTKRFPMLIAIPIARAASQSWFPVSTVLRGIDNVYTRRVWDEDGSLHLRFFPMATKILHTRNTARRSAPTALDCTQLPMARWAPCLAQRSVPS